MIEKLKHEQEKDYESILSWNWRDLMDGDEEVIKIFSKKSKPLIIFNLIIIIMFLPPFFI